MSSMNRTTCGCPECVACCKRKPGPLIGGDFERIADYLGELPERAKEHFTASRGSLIAYKGELHRIGTITPKQKDDGSCVFLDENDRCKIHPVAPFGCAYFDTHMDFEEANRRVKHAVQRHCDPEYQAFRDELLRREVLENDEVN